MEGGPIARIGCAHAPSEIRPNNEFATRKHKQYDCANPSERHPTSRKIGGTVKQNGYHTHGNNSSGKVIAEDNLIEGGDPVEDALGLGALESRFGTTTGCRGCRETAPTG